MSKIQYVYYGYIINNDPLIYKKKFELSYKSWEAHGFNGEIFFTTTQVTLKFLDELTERTIRDLKQWYNLGLSINGRKRYLNVINDDIHIDKNELTFTCLVKELNELLAVSTPVYNA